MPDIAAVAIAPPKAKETEQAVAWLIVRPDFRGGIRVTFCTDRALPRGGESGRWTTAVKLIPVKDECDLSLTFDHLVAKYISDPATLFPPAAPLPKGYGQPEPPRFTEAELVAAAMRRAKAPDTEVDKAWREMPHGPGAHGGRTVL